MEAPAHTRTTCPYCGVGCGLLASGPRHAATVVGDPDHPANFGRMCSKGAALGQTLGLEDRLLFPTMGGRAVEWDDALDTVARRFSETVAEHGPDSVAFYVSGQLLTEDYYVANKLMKGFLGSANIDTNSRLCMASTVAAYKRAFGADVVPCVYEDFEFADLVVLVGSNMAWCHPVLFQRLAAAREKYGTRVVVVDPRRTATCEIADLHLPIAPGSDVALFAGLLDYLEGGGFADDGYVAEHTRGAPEALRAARKLGQRGARLATGLPADILTRFYAMFATTARTVTAWSQGVNQSSAGTDKANAIINCHLLTGRIGRPGTGPFSLTGQPNAMGGREVGGLANMLAAHMELGNPEHRALVQKFWGSPRIAEREGLKAVDLFRAAGDGRVKAIWIAATNPAASMPDAQMVETALRKCPFVVVSDISASTDTARHAHVLLPAAAWGEKDGTVTNSERRISRQRAFLTAPADARPDWWMFAQVARRLGFAGFDYAGAADVLREHAALTAAANDGARALDLSALQYVDNDTYDAMDPVQWPMPAGAASSGHATASSLRMFADGRFFTADGRARLVATPFRSAASAPTERFPFVVNTGRTRDQWHTMTWSGKSSRLMSHTAEPFVEIHPRDAAELGIAPASLAVVESARGTMIARALITDRQREGSLFVPMHWTDQHSAHGRIDRLIAPNTDPVSGQPELKYTVASVRAWPARWYGYAVTTRRPTAPRFSAHSAWQQCDYRVIAPVAGGWQIEMAGSSALADVESFARWIARGGGGGGSGGGSGGGGGGGDSGSGGSNGAELLAMRDATRGTHRVAVLEEGRLMAALFVSREPVAIDRSFLISRLGTPMEGRERGRILAGRGGDGAQTGAIVCVCYGVSASAIRNAGSEGACTVAAIGACTMAGTGCGSCRMEIARILRELAAATASTVAAAS